MNYNLNILTDHTRQKRSTGKALRKLWPYLSKERTTLFLALGAILCSSAFMLAGPILMGYAIDHYIQHKQFQPVLMFGAILLGIYLLSMLLSYLQTKLMGGVGQRMLYNLRNAIFTKLQELPIAFFNQNKAGDLISRINNDTDKVNLFFSQSLMQFLGSIFIMTGAGIFLLSINLRLGAAALAPAAVLLLFTRVISPWVKRRNAANLKSTGYLSAEIQDSLNNFKVIIAFNRRDYFRKRFNNANNQNYHAAVKAGLANNLFLPVFGFSSNIAQLLVLTYGLYLIANGAFSIGLLISFLAYVSNFYNPIRQLAALWANFQVAMAGWDRITDILNLESNLLVADQPEAATNGQNTLISFRNVHFSYPDGKEVLHHINFELERGKTYALVGPTGGGKTTTASLVARLYDPTEGTVLLDGRDIRSYSFEDRTKKIGFILQDPFLFSGTIRENILYGNEAFRDYSNEQLVDILRQYNLDTLLHRFEKGLDTEIKPGSDTISLGQKQLIAFMRAVLRKPDLLILDEATANIDTITEQLLENILTQLPENTTQVIIAHRLNTIRNADEIFFVNSGEIIRAGSFDHALDMLMTNKRAS